MTGKIFSLLTVFTLLIHSIAAAVPMVWNSGAGGTWETTSSWLPLKAPAPGDDVVITGADTGTITINADATIGTLSLRGSHRLALNSGTLTISPALPEYTLSITQTGGTGSGTVTDSTTAINCGTTCSARFEKGSIVMLKASATTNSLLSNWSGGEGYAIDDQYFVTMGADTIVTAAFNINPSVAAFSFSPAKSYSGQTVQFTDLSTGTPMSWSWVFGDGTTGTDQNPRHVYTSVGTYIVALTVSNASGLDSSTMQTVTTTSAGMLLTAHDAIRNWRSVASSSNGSKLVAAVMGGYIFTSTDSGASWTQRNKAGVWIAVASSADGSKLVAAELGGQIHTSTDSGITWIPRDAIRIWTTVAASADGDKLVAAEMGGHIYTSIDSGISWTERENTRNWMSVASSANGSNLVATEAALGYLYTSTDSGATWIARDTARGWYSVAMSSAGDKMVATDNTGQIFISSDGGATWTNSGFPGNNTWVSASSSADGNVLFGFAEDGALYTSINSGESWDTSTTGINWTAAASSADGARLAAVAAGDKIYTILF